MTRDHVGSAALLDPTDAEQAKIIDRLYGLESAIGTKVKWCGGARLASSLGPPAYFETVLARASMSWPSGPSPEVVAKHRARLATLLCRVYPADVDVLLAWYGGEQQGSIAHRLGLTQPAVSERCAAATRRLEVASRLPDHHATAIYDHFIGLGVRSEYAMYVATYYWLPSQSGVASYYGTSQGRVRYALTVCLDQDPGHPIQILIKQWHSRVGQRGVEAFRGGVRGEREVRRLVDRCQG
ncbi:MAG: hypothetical protein H6733_07905 [Alphaproteobacteria bacterium]|nr:hypothetical protein [Alphaproteobacteria bacterium]